MLTTLQGRVALVTGGSRGIGRAIAQRLAAHGASVVVTASSRSAKGLQETCAFIQDAGGQARALIADLADEKARSQLVSEAAAPFGPVDILVNNAAAISAYAPPSKIDLPARRAMFEVNFHAPVDLIQQALPGMRDRKWGRILNISSETSSQPPIPYPGPAKLVHALTIYGCSKTALERYTKGLAAELQGTGIHVNAVYPYRIALSESARIVAKELGKSHPDWVEPLEIMAEAAYLLIASQHTGVVAISRDVLQMTQSPLHALDGKTVIGDALTLAKLD